MSLAKFEISTTPGSEHVIINGDDITKKVRLRSIGVFAQPGAIPTVTLEVFGPTVIDGEGIVYVKPEQTEGHLVAWLEKIDPSELEKEVLRRLNFSTGDTFATALSILKEWISVGYHDRT